MFILEGKKITDDECTHSRIYDEFEKSANESRKRLKRYEPIEAKCPDCKEILFVESVEKWEDIC